MADIKKYLDTAALSTLVEQIKAEDEKVKAYADTQIEAAGKTYDVAGAAATALSDAKAYTDELESGQVADNAAAIAKLNGDATTEGSVAKAVADSAATLQASIDAVDAIADKNAADIDTLEGKVSALEAGTYDDTEVRELISANASAIDTLEETHAEDKTALEKAIADEVTTARAAEEANAAAIKAISDDYLKAADKAELASDISDAAKAAADAQADIDAFMEAAEVGEAAVDTLKEIQAYITSDGEAAAQMTSDIAANAEAIAELAEADVTLDERIDAIETQLGEGEGSVADQIATAKQEAIDTAATAADTKDAEILKQAKEYADIEDARIESRVDSLEGSAHTHSNKALLDTYTQTEADLADAVAKKHEHENKAILDAITAAEIAAWNAAEVNAKAYAKEYADGLNATMQSTVNGVATRVTTLEETIVDKADSNDLDAAVARIAANETAIAANTSAINSFTAITSDEVNALFA